MAKSKDLREIAISHFQDGKSPTEIEKLVKKKADRSTISRWIKRFNETNSICRIKPPGRKKFVRNKRLVNLVKKRLKSKSRRKSLRKMAEDFKCGKTTIEDVLKDDLSLRCYRKTKVQLLKEEDIEKRKSRCSWIRKHIKKEVLEKTMFTDEKIFTVDGFHNPKNSVVWSESRIDANENGGTFAQQKYPISVMVAIGVTWNGLTRPYFLEKDERLNKDSYSKIILFYKKEGDRLFNSTNWNFQQDGASCHTAAKVQELCENTFFSLIPASKWPPNSPDLNPLDYSVWEKISSNICYKNAKSRDSLIKEIKKSCKQIEVDYVREVIGSFLRRVYEVEKNKGDYILNKFS